MLRYSGNTAICLSVAIGALVLIGAEPTGRKYDARNYFSDPKVAELAEAARKGDVERIDALVAEGVNVNARGHSQDAPSMNGITPLIYSMVGESRKGFQRLLERGADPNLQTDIGDSAMSFAAHRKESESLKLLLAHGGNPNLRSAVVPHKDDWKPTPIFDAISGRNAENARILIKAGANLNVRNSFGWTPLMSAAAQNSFEVMYMLLEGDADFRAKDKLGYPVSHFILDSIIQDEKSPLVKQRQKCIEFMEKKGVNFEEEKKKNAEIRRRIEEKLKKEGPECFSPDKDEPQRGEKVRRKEEKRGERVPGTVSPS